MIKYLLYIVSCLLTTTLINDCYAQTAQDSAAKRMFFEVQKSHIDANVPDSSQFSTLMRRDLEKYFSSTFGQVTVTWDFLRKGPTQSGVAYPKFYLWTKITNGKKLISEGAVRVAAIEKTSFDVTDYVDIEEIRKKSKDIYNIFPRAVCVEIESRLRTK